MSEITRVPLLPIARGSLRKLWLGAVLVVAAGAGLAWATRIDFQTLDGGVRLVTLTEGKGASPGARDFVLVNYRGTLTDSTVFDEGQNRPFQVNGVVPGFSTALQKMAKGGHYRVEIPSSEGYGAQGQGPIPPDADLTFDVELLDVRSEAEVMQMMQMQQMMQQMQGKGAGPGAPPAQ